MMNMPNRKSEIEDPQSRHAHLFFMDGVGLGGDDPAVNPFVTADLPFLTGLLGEQWFLKDNGRITTDRASGDLDRTQRACTRWRTLWA